MEPIYILDFDINKKEGQKGLAEYVRKKVFDEGLAPKEVFEVPDNIVDELYSMGHLLYTHGKYDDAIEIFRHLIMLQPKSYLYALALASTLENANKLDLAIQAYSLASINQPNNVLPLFRAAECAHKLNKPTIANSFYEAVVRTEDHSKVNESLKEKARLILKAK